MILAVTLNPSVDHAAFLKEFKPHDANRVERTETDAGGKGVNLARVAAELGGKTLATGFLGGGNGAYVRRVLDAQGVPHDFIEIEGETRTNFSVEDESDEPPTTFNEPGPQISSAEFQAFLTKCGELAAGCKWAAMGGSIPPGVPEDVFATLATLFRGAGCRVVLDADGAPLKQGISAGVDFIKPNAREAERLLGRPVSSEAEAISAASELRSKADLVVISRGEDGAVMACADGVFSASSPKVDVQSTIGSGDSLIGAMLWAIEENRPLEEAFRWGIAAGAATATTDGSQIARKQTILDLFARVEVRRGA